MRRTYIISAIIGAAALVPAVTVMAGQPYPTDYQSMVKLPQSAQAEHQNKMREWTMGLGVDLPGAPPLASASHSAPADVSAETVQPYRATHQDMKQLQLVKETEHQRRMREWAIGLGIALPSAGIAAQSYAVPNTMIADRGRDERSQAYGHEADDEHTRSATHDDDEERTHSRDHDDRDDDGEERN